MSNETSEHRILLIDTEENVINALRRELRREPYQILTATRAEQALSIMKEHAIQVLIADIRLEGTSGIDFMAKVKSMYPQTIRIILSGYTDIDTVAASINKGHVYKYLLKPWDKLELKETIRQSLDLWHLQAQNTALNEQIKKQNEELRYLNKNLEKEVEKRTIELIQKNKELNLSYEILEHLPLGVIGATEQGNVIFSNGLAKLYFERDNIPLVGSTLAAHFDFDLVQLAEEAIKTYLPQHMKYYFNESLTFHVKCVPLDTELNANGVIISFVELQ
ncbi:response regulator [candidate division KSB1 bacterium]|nr:response regulator [candidate division KSB1 bacterium]